MTLFSQLSFSQANKKEFKTLATMNALALIVFLFVFFISTVAHASHIAIQPINAESQECYICHQGLDAAPELPQVQTVFIPSYSVTPNKAVIAQFKVNSFVQPQLRAPPVVQ